MSVYIYISMKKCRIIRLSYPKVYSLCIYIYTHIYIYIQYYYSLFSITSMVFIPPFDHLAINPLVNRIMFLVRIVFVGVYPICKYCWFYILSYQHQIFHAKHPLPSFTNLFFSKIHEFKIVLVISSEITFKFNVNPIKIPFQFPFNPLFSVLHKPAARGVHHQFQSHSDPISPNVSPVYIHIRIPSGNLT